MMQGHAGDSVVTIVTSLVTVLILVLLRDTRQGIIYRVDWGGMYAERNRCLSTDT